MRYNKFKSWLHSKGGEFDKLKTTYFAANKRSVFTRQEIEVKRKQTKWIKIVIGRRNFPIYSKRCSYNT